MSEFTVHHLLTTETIKVRDVYCSGDHEDGTSDECALETQLVFPYRGVYLRHLGPDDAVAEVNQVLFFNAGEAYRISHPVPGGDASITVLVTEEALCEIAPPSLLRRRGELAFRPHRLRIDPEVQRLMAVLRHRLHRGIADPLEAESLALALTQRAFGSYPPRAISVGSAKRRLVDRAKVVLSSDIARRWTLGEVAAEVSCSPVYLTQVFQEVEGLPLYRYQSRLRLARALDRLADYDDLTRLGLDLGYSSHSHFTAAFRQLYGHTPSEFRQHALH